jgi:hypothetical protein
MRRLFISHPYSRDPKTSRAAVGALARRCAHEGNFPLAPQIYLPLFIDEATERDLALKLCLELVALSHEVRVYEEPSEGMRLEIAEAHRLGIPVLDGQTGEPFVEKEPPQ